MDTSPTSDITSELESFREQWRQEVLARNRGSRGASAQDRTGSSSSQGPAPAAAPSSVSQASASSQRPAPRRPPPMSKGKKPPAAQGSAGDEDDDAEEEGGKEVESVRPSGHRVFDGNAAVPSSATAAESAARKKGDDESSASALDLYERAVDKEAVGNLGDSLRLYRKAFRMDHRVDQKYKSKHFPVPAGSKPTHHHHHQQPPHQEHQQQWKTQSGTSSAAAAAATTSRPSATSSVASSGPLTMDELIASFAGLAIQPPPPEIEGQPPPPCPLAALPDEILVHILRYLAVLDVGDFVRLSQVCRRLAYLVATEEAIWRRVCLGSEFGFGGMHYRWRRAVTWEPLGLDERTTTDGAAAAAAAAARAYAVDEEAVEEEEEAAEKEATTHAFLNTLYGSSWLRMFRLRPRVRFNGCYISTVNYIRAGQASAHQVTWNSPVHIVTYYRYLRFFRDGTALSLLTTAEPADVVHHLTKEALAQYGPRSATAERRRRGGLLDNTSSTSAAAAAAAAAGSSSGTAGGAGATTVVAPAAVMQSALRGRWRLASAADNPEASLSEVEGDLYVETEGVGKYLYRMDLALRSSGGGGRLGGGGGGGPRNNKLIWRGFYSYDRLTDDWAEFGLRNDKPFFFSRVRSYGMGW